MLVHSQLGIVRVAFDVEENLRLPLAYEQFGDPVLRRLQRVTELTFPCGRPARLAVGVMKPVLQQLNLMQWRAAAFQRGAAQVHHVLDDGLGRGNTVTVLRRLNEQAVNELPWRNALTGQEAGDRSVIEVLPGRVPVERDPERGQQIPHLFRQLPRRKRQIIAQWLQVTHDALPARARRPRCSGPPS